jgi:hypothetical protein
VGLALGAVALNTVRFMSNWRATGQRRTGSLNELSDDKRKHGLLLATLRYRANMVRQLRARRRNDVCQGVIAP